MARTPKTATGTPGNPPPSVPVAQSAPPSKNGGGTSPTPATGPQKKPASNTSTSKKSASNSSGGGGNDMVSSSVNTGAGFILATLFWVWVGLPFLQNGATGVKNQLRAKFLNKAPDGSWLP